MSENEAETNTENTAQAQFPNTIPVSHHIEGFPQRPEIMPPGVRPPIDGNIQTGPHQSGPFPPVSLCFF